jgi:hypothetical protein
MEQQLDLFNSCELLSFSDRESFAAEVQKFTDALLN